jgi:hypothetical protein
MNLRFSLTAIVLLSITAAPASAMDAGQYQELQKLMQTPVRVLADRASAIIREKYEIADFAIHNGADDSALPFNSLPEFVTRNQADYTAYRIATLKPELLEQQRCYCQRHDHTNLLQCFLASSKPLIYNDHASREPVCVSEALLTFLWTEMGATTADVGGYLRFIFDPQLNQSPQTPLN